MVSHEHKDPDKAQGEKCLVQGNLKMLQELFWETIPGKIREGLAKKNHLNRDLKEKQNLDMEENVLREILGPLQQ